MLAAGQGSDKIFAGVRFVLCGFDSVSEVQVVRNSIGVSDLFPFDLFVFHEFPVVSVPFGDCSEGRR